MKKLSIIGLVLLAASAVASAIVPSNRLVENGQLIPGQTTDFITCRLDYASLFDNDCNFTNGTATSVIGPNKTSADNGSSVFGGFNTSFDS